MRAGAYFPHVRYRTTPALAYWGIVLAAAVFFGRAPAFNWDGIAYVALALEREAEPRDAHRLSYAHLMAVAPEERYEELTTSSSYRAAMALLPEAFAENLRFYRMRYGYVGLLAGGHRLTGANPYRVSVAIGIAAFLLLAGAAWAWAGHALSRTGSEEVGWGRLLALPLVLHPGAVEAIALTTPDLLVAALLGWGAYFWVARADRGAAALVFLLAVLCRPDALIFGSAFLAAPAAIAAWAWWRGEPVSPRTVLAPLGLALGLFLVGFSLTRIGHAHAWGTVFSHTFLEHAVVPGGEAPGLLSYLQVVGTAILFLGSGLPTRILFCLSAGAVVFLFRRNGVHLPSRVFAGAALASWCAFFFLFPLPLERFYLAHVVVAGSLLLRGWTESRAHAAEKGTAPGLGVVDGATRS